MEKKSKAHTDLGIPDSELESLARVLLPLMQEYLMSEEGQRDYAEWTAKNNLIVNITIKRVLLNPKGQPYKIRNTKIRNDERLK